MRRGRDLFPKDPAEKKTIWQEYTGSVNRPEHSVRYSKDSSLISGNLWFSDLYFELYGMLVNYFSLCQSGSGDVILLE